ncbi:MarR family winged helix-turn-helix transcriptional regulator [Pseudonocardia kujensis]|uniref:MarR family winged helix-turn-helix transcriptional regulator n=1 Tax=Pseudonocardia kujensis TaxID=1128675 RepID=UPI001E2D1737|nr:MarR family winged helix-turn-helix transcriptional regulator [Pseudonocardia kujensis]MCE0763899.1 MarR family winged helix-turn-helix transcriptional regulator [Pseudonocardia kujensis]
MSTERPGFALPLLLLAGFQTLVDALHEDLAEQGHPEARPMHGFALQAVGEGTTAAELGRRLGVTKQAAAKTIAALGTAGYVERAADPTDARRVVVRPTARGRDLLARSAAIFDDLRARWVRELGEDAVRTIEDALGRITSGPRLDAPSWFTR